MESYTLEGLLEENLRRHPGKTAVWFEDIPYSWEDLDRMSCQLGDFFLAHGLGKGSRIGIIGKNSVIWLACFLAAGRMGGTAVLFNPGLLERELCDLLDYSCLNAVCLTDRERQLPEGCRQVLPQTPVWDRELLEAAACRKPACRTPDFDRREKPSPEDLLCMLFTSGTTARPKGVLLKQGAVIRVAWEAAEAMEWTEHDLSVLGLPLFHIFGLSAGFLAAAAAGMTVCLQDNGHSRNMMEAAERYRCTVLNGVPAMFLAMMRNPDFEKYDLSSLRTGVIAGAGITRKDYLEICRRIPFRNLSMSYGMTETSPSVTFSRPADPVEKKAESAGVVIPGVEVRIRPLDADGRAMPGETGEIMVKGFNLMAGYYRMEEATAGAFDREGWLHTGDIGALNEEGYLQVSGRLKDIIIRSGENISPKEVEEAVSLHPAVEEILVVGVPDPVTQEEAAACMVLNPGCRLEEGEMERFLSARLSAYKVPRYYLVWDCFPRISSGKTDIKEIKNRVCRLYEAGTIQKYKLQYMENGGSMNE